MNEKISKILISEQELTSICKALGEQISKDYKDKKLLLVGVLKGAVVFFAELLKNITCDVQIDFIEVSSYEGTKTTGKINFKKDLNINPQGFDILLVEDILESGTTLSYLKSLLLERNTASVKICTLLDKKCKRTCEIEADYLGRVIDDEFVVGFGLDYNEKYRNLPFVAVLDTCTNGKGANS